MIHRRFDPLSRSLKRVHADIFMLPCHFSLYVATIELQHEPCIFQVHNATCNFVIKMKIFFPEHLDRYLNVIHQLKAK